MKALSELCESVSALHISRNNHSIISAITYADEELSQAEVFILGYGEDRNSDNQGAGSAAQVIRVSLYSLFETSKPLRVIDLGNALLGETIADSYTNLSSIVEQLQQYDVPVIVFGGTQESCLSMLSSSFGKVAFPAASFVDARIDRGDDDTDFSNRNYLQAVSEKFPKARLIHIGGQEYLCPKETFDWWDRKYFPRKRLGECQDESSRIEPYLRDAQFVSFDMNVVRYSDNPAGLNTTGLYSETLCQYAWNCGYSPRMTVFSLSEFNPVRDVDGISAQLSAQVIWHVLDGISQRKKESGDFSDQSYICRYFKTKMLPQDICFYESTVSKTLWVEVPVGITGKKRIIPCSSFDYEQFIHGSIPDIWIQELHRLSEL